MRIAVVCGGDSRERPISLKSGAEVAAALSSVGQDVVRVELRAREIEPILRAKADVVFVALHGRFGEDGELARSLQDRGLCVTGPPPRACSVALDKVATRQTWERYGLPVARGVVVPEWVEKLTELPGAWDLPLVLKPAREGSSIGVRVPRDPEAFSADLGRVRILGDRVLCEEFLPGEEWTVGVLDSCPLPPIRIEYEAEVFDFDAKYRARTTHYRVDPPCAQRERIREVALHAAQVIGAETLCRVDMIVGSAGPVLLELNTTPGMTPRSLLPLAAHAVGLSFSDLCLKIASMAAKCPKGAIELMLPTLGSR